MKIKNILLICILFIFISFSIISVSTSEVDLFKIYNNNTQEIEIYYGEHTWAEIIKNDDSNLDINYTFYNSTLMEIGIINNGGNGYKFTGAICNISGFEDIIKYEYNPLTEIWTNTGSLNYGRLLHYGLNDTLCQDQNNYGFIVFSSSSQDRRIRLEFSNTDKEMTIYLGDREDFLDFGQHTFERIKLVENTNVCGKDCYAIKNFTIYENTSLVDDIRFFRLINGEWVLGNIRNYNIYLYKNNHWIDYFFNQTLYGNLTGVNYTIKIEGYKNPSWIYDWQILNNGFWSLEWAIWGNISEGDDAEVYQISPIDNSVSQTNTDLFQCFGNITGGTEIVNMSLWGDFNGTWLLNETQPEEYNIIIFGDNLDESSLEINQNVVTEIATGVWKINNTDADYEVQRALVIKTLFYGTDGSDPRAISQYINATNVYSNDWRDSETRGVYATASTGFDKNTHFRYVGQFSDKDNNYVVSSWSYVYLREGSSSAYYSRWEVPNGTILNSVTGGVGGVCGVTPCISDETGTDRSSDEKSNPLGVELEVNAPSFGGSISYVNSFFLTRGNISSWSRINVRGSGGTNSSTDFYDDEGFPIIEYRPIFKKKIIDDTTWSCESCDSEGNCSFSNTNFTILLNVAPTIIINSPEGIVDTNNVTFNFTFIDDLNLTDYCSYNVTNSSLDVIISENEINCSNAMEYQTISDGENYNLNVFVNDTINNINTTTKLFSIDTTPPNINIFEPQAQNYANNNSIELNFSITDNILGVDSCWYKVDLISPSLNAISNTTISNCENTTFALPGGDEDYKLTLYANDTIGNENSSTVTFGIRTENPSITLDKPTNNEFINNNLNVDFNFTASDNDGVDTCSLWGNWTGTWHLNESFNATSGVQVNTKKNITDGTYLYNSFCNDTLNNGGWALNNFTFTIDTIFPNITLNSISTTGGSQTIGFISTEQDLNLESCFYSIFNSSGDIDGVNENVTYTCGEGLPHSATATSFGSFNLTIYATDLANNQNSTTSEFTVTQLPTGTITGGGGGGGTTEFQTVITIVKPEEFTRVTNDLQRAILYSRINDFCENFSISTKTCSLPLDERTNLLDKLKQQFTKVSSDELDLWIDNFNKNNLENEKIILSEVERYDLDAIKIVFEQLAFFVNPFRVDKFYLISSTPPKPFKTIVQSSEILSSVDVVQGELGLTATLLTSTTVEVKFEIVNGLDFTARTSDGVINYVSQSGESVFQPIRIRIIYLFHPAIIIGAIVLLVGGFLIFRYWKRILKGFKKGFKKFKKLVK